MVGFRNGVLKPRGGALSLTMLLAMLCVALTGCPWFNNVDIELRVSPTQLDFGTQTTPLSLTVGINATSRHMAPLVVTPVQPWIVIGACQDTSAGCVLENESGKLTIPVTLKPSLMTLGGNAGTILVQSEGAATVEVSVVANVQISADFTVPSEALFAGDPILFTDASASGLTSISSWYWEFGDGITGVQRNPVHTFAQSGLYKVTLTIASGTSGSSSITHEVLVRGKVAPKAAFVKGLNEIQQVVVSGAIDGSFTLTFHNQTTAPIDYHADGAAVQKALEALAAIGLGGISAIGVPGGPYHLTFQGSLAQKDVEPLTGDVSKLTPQEARSNENERFKTIPVAEITVITLLDGLANVPTPQAGSTMQFVDTSVKGTMPITSWRWHIEGQGQMFNGAQPALAYTFAQPGDYQISLTVITAHGQDTFTESLVVAPPPLVAAFSPDKPRALTVANVTFTDESTQGNIPITQWRWNFGDGRTSTERNPVHMYTTPGRYPVELEVTGLLGAQAKTQQDINVFASRPIDDYIRSVDDSYSFIEETTPITPEGIGVTIHSFAMSSQRWRTSVGEGEGEGENEGEVDRSLWQHCMTIIKPVGTMNRTGLLLIDGGSNRDDCSPSSELIAFAKESNAVVAVIKQVPNEPLIFTNDPDPDNRYATTGRTEDQIIALSYYKYLKTMDATWPALLPMTKSAVRAMDTIQDLLRDPLHPDLPLVKRFVVTGGSKRGWTTWLTAAADSRVTAIAPVVIDVLNMTVQMEHHRAVYGGFSTAIQAYVDLHVFEHNNSPEGQSLLKIVDPFQYRDRLIMPKLLINSTGDEFFVPDSAQFYFKQLAGENYLTYAPNTDHYTSSTAAPALLAPWFQSIANGDNNRPSFSWEASDDNTHIDLETQTAPDKVLMWTAVSSNRDFRWSYTPNPPAWTSIELTPIGLTETGRIRYVAQPARSQTAWTGFFIQLTYNSPYELNETPAPFQMCTELRVAPPMTPVPPIANLSWDDSTKPVVGKAIQFTDLTAEGTSPVSSWTWDFGDETPKSRMKDPQHVYLETGKYDVTLEVITLDGMSSATKSITIGEAPTITAQPQSLTVNVGQLATFSVTAVGTAPLSYQWSKGANAIVSATLATFSIAKAQLSDKGLYSCVASNAFSSATSNAALLTVQQASEGEGEGEGEGDLTSPSVVLTTTAGNPTNISPIPIKATFSEAVTGFELGDVSVSNGTPGNFLASDEFHYQFNVMPIAQGIVTVDIAANKAQDPAGNPNTAAPQLRLTYNGQAGPAVELTTTVEEPMIGDPTIVSRIPVTAKFSALVREFEESDVIVGNGRIAKDTFLAVDASQYQFDVTPIGQGIVTVDVPANVAQDPAGNPNKAAAQLRRTYDFGTALDRYIAAPDPDPAYKYEPRPTSTTKTDGCTIYVVSLRSQEWRDTSEILSPRWPDDLGVLHAYWNHWMTIVVPDIVRSKTSLLVITGGSYDPSQPPDVANISSSDPYLSSLTLISRTTGSVVTLLDDVPNEPITFTDTPYRSRSEDAIIAYTYDKFEKTDAGNPNTTWPLLLPMVKSAFRAMDTVQDFCARPELFASPISIDDFVVTGASKRGWTTWLTAVADAHLSADLSRVPHQRVKAIVPMVIDVLNMGLQMQHQKFAYASSYGLRNDPFQLESPPFIWKGYSSAVANYVEFDIFDSFNSREGQALLDIVDPYRYRHRLTKPKLIVNSTGDEFFLPDSSQFYYHNIPGKNLLHYLPNSHHGLDQFDPLYPTNSLGWKEAVDSAMTFYYAMLTDPSPPLAADLPNIDWTLEADGNIRVATDLTPFEVNMWQASTTNGAVTITPPIDLHYPNARDFRLPITGPIWTSTPLQSIDHGIYRARPADPPLGQWTGFFVQLKYRSPIPESPYIFTTQIRVLPDTYFSPTLYLQHGSRTLVGQGPHAVPLLVLSGTPYEMGRRYGELMVTEIQAFLQAFLASAQDQDPAKFSTANLDAAWNQAAPYIEPRVVEEMNGMADGLALAGAGHNVDVVLLRRVHMIQSLRNYSCSSVAVWKEATTTGDMLQVRDLDCPLGELGWPRNNPLLQEYPCIVVYIPQNGSPHVNVTSAGMIGVHTGFNLAGVSLAEIGIPALDPELRGEPFMSFFRTILYDAKNLDSATDIIKTARRIRNSDYLIADGRWQRAAAKIHANAALTPPADFVVVNDNDPTSAEENSLNGQIDKFVVFNAQKKREDISGQVHQDVAWSLIDANYGKIDIPVMQQIARAIAKRDLIGSDDPDNPKVLNVLNVVYDSSTLELWFAYAEGKNDASTREFQYLNLNDYLRQGSSK